MEKVVIIGYSGHAYVVIDILKAQGYLISGYFDKSPKDHNPFSLTYLGDESHAGSEEYLAKSKFAVAIGNNITRQTIYERLIADHFSPVNAIHTRSTIGYGVKSGSGIMVMAGAIINAGSLIGDAVIINSGAIVEHECTISDFAHIAPGAVLAGNVSVGRASFIGANAVIKEGVKIGNNVIVGAGSVVIHDIPYGATVAGNPAKEIK